MTLPAETVVLTAGQYPITSAVCATIDGRVRSRRSELAE
jgi:hypothetical protein